VSAAAAAAFTWMLTQRAGTLMLMPPHSRPNGQTMSVVLSEIHEEWLGVGETQPHWLWLELLAAI